jgi:hypothetical protein
VNTIALVENKNIIKSKKLAEKAKQFNYKGNTGKLRIM